MNNQAGQQNSGSKPTAIGFIRSEVPGLDGPQLADKLRRHATKLGYQYLYTVRPPQDHDDPVGYALGIAAGMAADVIVVYDLASVDNSPARTCELFDLETVFPPETWARARLDGSSGGAVGAGVRVA